MIRCSYGVENGWILRQKTTWRKDLRDRCLELGNTRRCCWRRKPRKIPGKGEKAERREEKKIIKTVTSKPR